MQDHIPLPPAVPARRGAWRALLAVAVAAVVLVLGSVAAWRWTQANLLQAGIHDAGTTVLDETELLRRVRAFELGTVKHHYAGQARIDQDKELRAGPVRAGLPGWLAGQELRVRARATVTAGVDLDGVRPEDIEVVREGQAARVILHLPAPRVLSTELEPGSLDMATSQGIITRAGGRLGLSETDLRDRAADDVLRAAREQAVSLGILEEAATEAERRLQAFLSALPQPGSAVTYTVTVRPPAQT